MRGTYCIGFHLALNLTIGFTLLCSCSESGRRNTSGDKGVLSDTAFWKKHPSIYQDTMMVSTAAVVFFHPDSAQLDHFRRNSKKNEYETITHESFFQMRNARIVLNKYWPQLRVLQADSTRYLLFKKSNDEVTVIDLNNQGEHYGLFLFKPGKEPVLADMMNIETALGFYFNNGFR